MDIILRLSPLAAPIIGPCVAVYWGWLPGLLWVMLSTVFMGAVHDFGASNQMLAALTLMILTLYFWQKKKPILPLLITMLFIMFVTVTYLFIKAGQFLKTNSFLFALDIFLIVLIIWMIIEGFLTVFYKARER